MFANLSQFILIKKYFKTWEIWMLELIGKFSVHWPVPRKNTEQNFYTVAKARSQLYTLNTQQIVLQKLFILRLGK